MRLIDISTLVSIKLIDNGGKMNNSIKAGATEDFDTYVSKVAGKISKYLGEAGKDMTKEQSDMFHHEARELIRAAGNDYLSDLVVRKINKSHAGDIAAEVADKTLLAYDNWKWYADAAAKGVIGTAAALAIGVGATYLFGSKVTKGSGQAAPAGNPFGDLNFKATERPVRAARPESAQNLH